MRRLAQHTAPIGRMVRSYSVMLVCVLTWPSAVNLKRSSEGCLGGMVSPVLDEFRLSFIPLVTHIIFFKEKKTYMTAHYKK